MILRVLTTILTAAAVVACAGTPVQTELHDDVLNIDAKALAEGIADTLHFGRMNSGEIVVKRLSLHNDTSEPIVILRHENSCSCATFTYDHRPIMPDGYADIECTFDSRGTEGWQMKLAKFYLSGDSKPVRVFIEAEVR